jgi:hypothetical protein
MELWLPTSIYHQLFLSRGNCLKEILWSFGTVSTLWLPGRQGTRSHTHTRTKSSSVTGQDNYDSEIGGPGGDVTNVVATQAGLPDFSWYNIPTRGTIYHKIHQMATKYTKWPQNTPNGLKIYQLATK